MKWLVFTLIGALLLVAIFGPFLIGPEGLELNLARDLQPGYGENGFDALTWLIYGTRISLMIAGICTVVSLCIGVLYGAVSGYVGGFIDMVMMRFVDILLAFPGILLALYIAAVLKPGIGNIVVALCATGWVGYARIARSQVLSVKNQDYVTAALALGASHVRILLRHILPNIWGPLFVQASFGVSSLILAEASLSFWVWEYRLGRLLGALYWTKE